MKEFQSTLPARGATDAGAGSKRVQRFQSTLPARGATILSSVYAIRAMLISIHAPRTGSDGKPKRRKIILGGISIHAPRTGSDASASAAPCKCVYFNPRSPHGERPPARGRGTRAGGISIHAPRTGSDRRADSYIICTIKFQSTLPARGATAIRRNVLPSWQYFNPRSPHGERRKMFW